MSQHQIPITDSDTRIALMEQSHKMLEDKLDTVYTQLDSRLTRVETKVEDLGEQMRAGQAGLTKVIIGTGGTIVVAIISLIGVIIQYM